MLMETACSTLTRRQLNPTSMFARTLRLLTKRSGTCVPYFFFFCTTLRARGPVFSFSLADYAAEIFPQLHERAPAEGGRQHRAAGRRWAGEAALSLPLVQNQERHHPAPEQRHRSDQLFPGETSVLTPSPQSLGFAWQPFVLSRLSGPHQANPLSAHGCGHLHWRETRLLHLQTVSAGGVWLQ